MSGGMSSEGGNGPRMIPIDQLNIQDLSALQQQCDKMYVRGALDDVTTVLVDIGTGYYAEMNLAKAKDYFQRKQDYLAKQIEQVQTVVSEKQRAKGLIMSALESKVQASLSAQQNK